MHFVSHSFAHLHTHTPRGNLKFPFHLPALLEVGQIDPELMQTKFKMYTQNLTHKTYSGI